MLIYPILGTYQKTSNNNFMSLEVCISDIEIDSLNDKVSIISYHQQKVDKKTHNKFYNKS